MKLYYIPGSCALADHIVLEWIGRPYEAVRMTTESVDSPEYRFINPDGVVPFLVDGGFSLSQNAAILYYLGDQNPGANLFGDGTSRGRAEVMQWLAFLDSDVHSAFKPIFAPRRFLSRIEFVGAIMDSARLNVRRYLRRLDNRLAGREWLAGKRSVADPYLFVILRWANGLRDGLIGFDNLSRFAERMQTDTGVQTAIAAEDSEFDSVDLRRSGVAMTGLRQTR